MIELQTYLAECKKRLEAATPGPWFVDGSDVRGDYDSYATDNGIADCTVRVCEVFRISETLDGAKEDRDLIASAPSDLAKLIEIVECLREALDCVVGHDYGKSDLFDTMKNTVNEALRKADQLAKGDTNEV